jgi:glycerophosphoryl diester phosphodiesterase
MQMAEISAHRGGCEQARAATYAAYEHALASGAEYAEFDIRKAADGTLVVYHDQRLDHDGPLLSGLSYGELCERAGYPVPRVADTMAMLAGKVMGHLDLKETGYEAEVIRLALQHFGPAGFVATTMEDVSVRAIKDQFPDVRTALSLGRDAAEIPARKLAQVRQSELFPMRRIRACGADWVAANYQLARRGVTERCWKNGVGVMVWTVDADGLIDRFLADSRVNVLITNRPGFAVQRRSQLSADH